MSKLTKAEKKELRKLKGEYVKGDVPVDPPVSVEGYSFPSKSRCPRCKSLDTVAVSTQENIQYRLCRVAICRWKYAVIGGKV